MNDQVWFTIQSYPNPLPQEIEDQVQLLINEEHKDIPEEERVSHEEKFCSHADRFLNILAFESDRVIGIVKLYKRSVQYKDIDIMIGGFGGVRTAQNKRNQGVASSLLKYGMEILRQQDCDIAFLCANIADPKIVNLYSKFGFMVLGKNYTFFGKSGKLYEEPDGMLAPVASSQLFKAIMISSEKLHIGKGNW